ncbi:zinc transporter ZupT [bacterium]|nr:zinc transporter ZupT [bacterium]
MNNQILVALLLSALSGLATTIGSIIGIFVRKPGPRFLTFTLGFSAGVMILVSFVELLPKGINNLGMFWGLAAFFSGMGLMFVLDVLVPHSYMAEQPNKGEREKSRLMRTGLLVAFGIGIHNLPEGLAAFAGALQNLRLGVSIAVAVAIHNIPEGLAVSAPVYAATGSRSKAFWWSFLSGVAEPAGAALAALILLPFLNEKVLGAVLSAVAGIMVFISVDELIPASKKYGYDHLAITGIIVGMLIMAFSLLLLQKV